MDGGGGTGNGDGDAGGERSFVTFDGASGKADDFKYTNTLEPVSSDEDGDRADGNRAINRRVHADVRLRGPSFA